MEVSRSPIPNNNEETSNNNNKNTLDLIKKLIRIDSNIIDPSYYKILLDTLVRNAASNDEVLSTPFIL